MMWRAISARPRLEGVDFVRNHRAPGIDFASVHLYYDKWHCIEGGMFVGDWQDCVFKGWLDAHLQAAEEELAMPVVLEVGPMTPFCRVP